MAVGPPDGDPESRHRHRRAERESRIGHHRARGDKNENGGREKRECPQDGIASAAELRVNRDRNGICESKEKRGKPRSECADAKRAHRRRRQPRRERRLSPERNAVVELRREPVTGLEHFSRNLGVARLGGVRQRICPERGEPHHEDDDDDEHDGATLARRQDEGHVCGNAALSGAACTGRGRDGGMRR